MLVLAAMAAAPARAEDWKLFSRDLECLDLGILVRMERLPRAPASPEDFIALLGERGRGAELGLPKGFPAELEGRIVQVRLASGKGPIFIREGVCRTMDKGR